MLTKENKLLRIYKKLYKESFLEAKDKKFLFLFFCGLFFSLFFLSFFLIGKNPYSLLIPFSLYDTHLFLYDKRSSAVVFLSDGKGNFFPIKKKLLKTGNLREDIKKLTIEVSEPPYFELDYSNSENLQRTYKKLPNIHLALIQIWIVKDNLILDFRESTLKEEMKSQRVKLETKEHEIGEAESKSELAKEKLIEDKNKELLEKLKMDLLGYAFLALEKSIFENFPQIKTIEYRLNGFQKDFLGMDYKLSEKKTR